MNLTKKEYPPQGRYSEEEIFRAKSRDRAKVVVGVAHPVGVEPDPAVVEVEDRRVVKPAAGIRKLPLSAHDTGNRVHSLA